MALSPETKEKLQRRIDELKKRMLYDANDLDYDMTGGDRVETGS